MRNQQEKFACTRIWVRLPGAMELLLKSKWEIRRATCPQILESAYKALVSETGASLPLRVLSKIFQKAVELSVHIYYAQKVGLAQS